MKQYSKHRALWFGLGLAFGLLLSRKRTARPEKAEKALAQFAIWEETLKSKYGAQKAALLAAQTRARYAALFNDRPRFSQPALRSHLETRILPGVALYQVLLNETGEQAEALADLDACFAMHAKVSPMARQVGLIDRLPGKFAALRLANRVILKRGFPEQGWKIDWVEDSPTRIAYDITGCFYLNILSSYGVAELTAHYCALDDQLYSCLKSVSWERTETLGRGNARCNFVFRPRVEEN